jgi:very-short-patch-repair endonuclease
MGEFTDREQAIQRGERPTRRRPKRRSWLEDRLVGYLTQHPHLPSPVRELRFAAPRLFRFDFAWPALGIALEAEGGIWSQGRHSRGSGFVADVEKYNLAAQLGWRVFRVTEREVKNGAAFALLEQILLTPIRYQSPVLIEVAGDAAPPPRRSGA